MQQNLLRIKEIRLYRFNEYCFNLKPELKHKKNFFLIKQEIGRINGK